MDWLILAALAVMAPAVALAEETCRSADENPYVKFGDKTAYLLSRKSTIDKVTDVPGCEPIALWLLNRHGSHNPEVDQIAGLKELLDFKNNIQSNYRNGNFRNTNQRICSADLKLLEQWQPGSSLDATSAGHLTADGYMTTQERAREWRQKYPGLINENTHNYMFKFSDEPRSKTTFKAFTEGLFRAQAEIYDIPKETDENVDRLLRPDKFCPAWLQQSTANDTLTQRQIFESKQEYREMITNISKRLGFTYDIHAATVLQMYDMCRYNKAWLLNTISPWCAVFTNEDLRILEYAQDLESYYKYGYGNTLNQKVGCTLVKGMMEFFNKTHIAHAEHPQQPKLMVQFGDAASILLLMTALSGYRDPAPITGDNFRSPQTQEREWKTSDIVPFNANIAAVLYKCNPNGKFQVHDLFQVLFLGNGQPIRIEGCRVGLCEWSAVLNKYSSLVDQCGQQYCNSANINYTFTLMILTTLSYFMLLV